MTAGAGHPPPARETRQALPEPERPGRNRILEPLTSARRQRLTPPDRPWQAELQLEPASRLRRNSGRRTSNPPCPYHSNQDKPANQEQTIIYRSTVDTPGRITWQGHANGPD
jgi:hypothetical protein